MYLIILYLVYCCSFGWLRHQSGTWRFNVSAQRFHNRYGTSDESPYQFHVFLGVKLDYEITNFKEIIRFYKINHLGFLSPNIWMNVGWAELSECTFIIWFVSSQWPFLIGECRFVSTLQIFPFSSTFMTSFFFMLWHNLIVFGLEVHLAMIEIWTIDIHILYALSITYR